MVYLARLLASEGHEVRCFALGAEGAGTWDAPCAGDCCAGADCAVLPMPVAAAPGILSAPGDGGTYDLHMIFDCVPKRIFLCGGRVDGETASLAAAHGLRIRDYFAREEMTVGNAAATAEGALELLIRETPFTLLDSRVLVLGFGRIGKLLALRLRDMGAKVTVAARKGSDRAWARALGMEDTDTAALTGKLGDFDVIVNTVPALLLTDTLLSETKRDVFILDLASRPGGTDFAAAARLDRRAVWALGLPAETAPQTAAKLMRESIFAMMEEEHG